MAWISFPPAAHHGSYPQGNCSWLEKDSTPEFTHAIPKGTTEQVTQDGVLAEKEGTMHIPGRGKEMTEETDMIQS